MKSLCAIFLLFIIILFVGCKKKETPAPDFYMTLKVNGIPIKYTDCAESEVIVGDQPRTTISAYYSSALDQTDKMFEIVLIADENNLKTGQVYQCQGIDSPNYENGTNVFFDYYAGGVDKIGTSSPAYSPVGTVTLTAVTPTTIKGTFSAYLSYSQSNVIADTITNGEFYSSHNHHTGVIQY